jgi:uncharacterized membrane protein YfcA
MCDWNLTQDPCHLIFMIVLSLGVLSVPIIILHKDLGLEKSTWARLVVIGFALWSVGYLAFHFMGRVFGSILAVVYTVLAFVLILRKDKPHAQKRRRTTTKKKPI